MFPHLNIYNLFTSIRIRNCAPKLCSKNCKRAFKWIGLTTPYFKQGIIIIVSKFKRLGWFLMHSKGGFPFSAKCRAIDILRSLYFEIRAIKGNGWGWLNAFRKKVIAKSSSREILHWMEIGLNNYISCVTQLLHILGHQIIRKYSNVAYVPRVISLCHNMWLNFLLISFRKRTNFFGNSIM
jgi:hypothetical protein